MDAGLLTDTVLLAGDQLVIDTHKDPTINVHLGPPWQSRARFSVPLVAQPWDSDAIRKHSSAPPPQKTNVAATVPPGASDEGSMRTVEITVDLTGVAGWNETVVDQRRPAGLALP
jgi:hypothetical protein